MTRNHGIQCAVESQDASKSDDNAGLEPAIEGASGPLQGYGGRNWELRRTGDVWALDDQSISIRPRFPDVRGGPMDIVIRNATVLTMDERRRVIRDGAVAIADGAIVQVGRTDDVEGSGAKEIDGRGKIVMPGLINPHIHLSYSLAAGCGDDLPFREWLPVVFRVQDAYTEQEWHLASLLSMVEAIKSGTTCVADTSIYGQFPDVARAVEESGIRAVLGKNITNITPEGLKRHPWLDRPFDRERLSIQAAVKDHQSWNGKADGRIRVRFSPQLWPACSTEGYREVAGLCREMGVGTLIHHTEVKEWGQFVEQEYGKPPTMMLNDFGILGPHTLLENASMLSAEEMALIAETGTCFNYLPTANMKNYLGVLDVTELLGHGITMSLGTSGALINNVNDMFREMKTLALQQRMLKERPDAIAPEDIVEMATLGGARCLGMEEEVGSLEPGKRADVIVIDTRQPHMTPMYNPVSTVVYCANGGDVETTIIDGQVVMLERRLLTVDEDALLRRAVDEGAAAIRRTGVLDEPQAQTRWELV